MMLHLNQTDLQLDRLASRRQTPSADGASSLALVKSARHGSGHGARPSYRTMRLSSGVGWTGLLQLSACMSPRRPAVGQGSEEEMKEGEEAGEMGGEEGRMQRMARK